ncbi:MAG: DegV family EDD domain-containing protein [Anaerolineaceae bacterium]|nr:MAG: DegV family EDD domain-containing protein [Anaerolineaceae bacterium]
MTAQFHIITDSAAHLSKDDLTIAPHLTIVPYRIAVDDLIYREGIEITGDNCADVLRHARSRPRLMSPTVADYERAFRAALENTDAILSIHTSREITDSWKNASEAAHSIGHKGIIVLDSRTICAGQGVLVREALQAATQCDNIDDIVRRVRGAIERVYSVYHIDSIEALRHSGILSDAHVALGAILGVKPILAVDDGCLVPIEKVRTRNQAIERLVEFMVEFTDIVQAMILGTRPIAESPMRPLQSRLREEFPACAFSFVRYNPSLAALIGIEATGICILEAEWDDSAPDDDF